MKEICIKVIIIRMYENAEAPWQKGGGPSHGGGVLSR